MRLGFDATVLAPSTRYTGAGQYAEKLLRHVTGLARDDLFVLYGPPGAAPYPGLPENVRWHSLPRLPFGKLSALATHLFVLPRLAREHRLDLLHAPTVHTRPSLPPVPRALPCRLVVTLHDVIPLTFYGGSQPAMPWRLRTFYRWNLLAVKRAKRIITVSHTSREEILETLRVPSHRVIAIHNGIDFEPKSDGKTGEAGNVLPLKTPYMLFVGSFEPRKNLPRLLQAFDSVFQQGLPHHLIMVVDSRSGHAHQVRVYAEGLSCRDRLHFFSNLEEPALRNLYRSADLFVFPSLSEGFGLPPLQAMASAIPVVASDIPALREVLGEAAYYVDPYSVDAIAEGLLRVASDQGLREGLSAVGLRQAARYSWEEAAGRTLEVYRSVVGEPAGAGVPG